MYVFLFNITLLCINTYVQSCWINYVYEYVYVYIGAEQRLIYTGFIRQNLEKKLYMIQ